MDQGSDDHSDLDDGREVYDWASRYPAGAWFQIVPEFLLLTAFGATRLFLARSDYRASRRNFAR